MAAARRSVHQTAVRSVVLTVAAGAGASSRYCRVGRVRALRTRSDHDRAGGAAGKGGRPWTDHDALPAEPAVRVELLREARQPLEVAVGVPGIGGVTDRRDRHGGLFDRPW